MKKASNETPRFRITIEMWDESRVSLHVENRDAPRSGQSLIQQFREVCFQMLDLADQMEPPGDELMDLPDHEPKN